MFTIEQSYRASIAAIIVNEKKQFLFSRLKGEQKNRWDFVKGGMNEGENDVTTLQRKNLIGLKLLLKINCIHNFSIKGHYCPFTEILYTIRK